MCANEEVAKETCKQALRIASTRHNVFPQSHYLVDNKYVVVYNTGAEAKAIDGVSLQVELGGKPVKV